MSRAPFTKRFSKGQGFTLLEVVIAMAILAVILVSIVDVTQVSLASHVYAKKLTVATLLARGKMIDLEQDLFDKGFPADDDEDAGDFSDEGWPSIKWRAKIIAPKTNGLTPEQLFAAVFNIPMGGDEEGGGGGGAAAMLAMFTGGGAPPGGAAPAAQLLGGAGGGMLQQQFQMMTDQIGKAVREVHLTVTWKDGKATESIDLVTHVVSLGPGSDRNGGTTVAQQLAQNDGTMPSEIWVRVDNGQLVTNPKPSPTGQGMVDPKDGMQLMKHAEWLATRGGQSGGAAPALGGPRQNLLPEGMGTLSPIAPGGVRMPGRPPPGNRN
jgi:general secretion pathway protein I